MTKAMIHREMTLATRQVLEAGVVLFASLTPGLHPARVAYDAAASPRLALILGLEAVIAMAMWAGRAKWRERIWQAWQRSMQALVMSMQWSEDHEPPMQLERIAAPPPAVCQPLVPVRAAA